MTVLLVLITAPVGAMVSAVTILAIHSRMRIRRIQSEIDGAKARNAEILARLDRVAHSG